MIIIIISLISLAQSVEDTTTIVTNKVARITDNKFQYGDSFLTISQKCRQFFNFDPLFIPNINNNQVFKMSQYCHDIVRANDFYNYERDIGNSTIEKKTIQTNMTLYTCTMYVNFDGGEYCCCPDRKQFSINGPELTAIIIVPILTFFLLIGGCLFCLKQKIKKAEYKIIEQ